MEFIKKFAKDKGITLIALVVTIIVLLILAGISISMLTGENGIIKMAVQAKEKTSTSQDLEMLQLKTTDLLAGYYMDGMTTDKNDYLLEELSKVSGVTNVDKEKGTITYNGNVYELSKLTGKSNEQENIENSGLKQITLATATDENDKVILQKENIKMIVEDENGCKAVIPRGFYYVKGTPTEGMVISDVSGDDDNNTKGGNQFVWIPCNGNTLTYEKDSSKENNGLASFWVDDKYNNVQWYYNTVPSSQANNVGKEITDWKDDGGNETSVNLYKGFYVARFEAGVPSTADFYADGITKTTNYSYDKKNAVTDDVPVSKKNNQSWNYISQTRAKAVSEKMYSSSDSSVTSSLIDSYAWDTTVRWLCDSGKKYNTTTNNQDLKLGINSRDFGNYMDNTTIKETNGLYAIHRLTRDKDTNNGLSWSRGTKYQFGKVPVNRNVYITDGNTGEYKDIFADTNYDYTQYKYITQFEIATGSSEQTKIKEIYDMAGNMWEWTTETGMHTVKIDENTSGWDGNGDGNGKYTFAVLRGGSFFNSGSSAVSYRYGGNSAGGCYIFVGFRVVLYIK